MWIKEIWSIGADCKHNFKNFILTILNLRINKLIFNAYFIVKCKHFKKHPVQLIVSKYLHRRIVKNPIPKPKKFFCYQVFRCMKLYAVQG